ncbi:MAG: hypothetical protein L6R41_004308 [Letrouitia leprolyta]|nr:MAG: hypothetical protein L6R41_004308 [Letrouitia leprolyta]
MPCPAIRSLLFEDEGKAGLLPSLLGGEEVLLDVGGQDATEAFEDVGHSDEARSILEGLKTADLKRKPGEAPAPEVSATSTSTSTSTQPTSSANDAGMGIVFYALVLLGGGLAFGAYKYLQAKSSGEAGK